MKVKKTEWVNVKSLLREGQCSQQIASPSRYKILRGEVHLQGYSNVAQKMMRDMGWTPGQGIGEQSQGIPEPIPAQVGQTDRAGLGLPGKGGGRWKPPKKEKLVGVWTPTKIVYGTHVKGPT